MRLQKYLSRAGVASRRASEDLISAGRVRVDGEPVETPGTRVDPEQSVVEVDGRRVELSPIRWIAFHKPPGVLTTRRDPQGRATVYDALPEGPLQDLFHVGRLDYMSEGLLLLTNDGDVAHRLLHPRWEVEKRYEVGVAEPVPHDLAKQLLSGVELGDGMARADAASLLPSTGGDTRVLLVSLHEGRNREIRRMLDAVGVTVHFLRRLAFGPTELGELPQGEWRELEESEIRELRRRVGLAKSNTE